MGLVVRKTMDHWNSSPFSRLTTFILMGERNMQTWWLAALGLTAGLCTSLSFVPQVIKSWREGDTEAISKRMYVASLIAYWLWIVHGLMITSVPVILFNAVNVVLACLILVLKLRGPKAAQGR
jgi:MtN3 and saliva related transmembrane protein